MSERRAPEFTPPDEAGDTPPAPGTPPVAESPSEHRHPMPAELAEPDWETVACMIRTAEDLNSTLDLDEVLRRISVRLRRDIEHDTFAVLLLDPLGQELRFRFSLGYPSEVSERWRFGLGQGIVGTAAQTGKPILVLDVKDDARYIEAGDHVRSELAIPLIVRGRTIGVLVLGSKQPHQFTEGHQRWLLLIGGHLANAIENARLYENVRQQARTLSLLHEVSRELTSILDREALLLRVAELVKRLIDYQWFSVLLWREDTQRLEHVFALQYDERRHTKDAYPLGYGITGTAAALRQTIRVPNVHLDPRHVPGEAGSGVRSELAVPLVFKDHLVGVLDLESVEYNAFSEQHEQMLATLASYVAIALENARLYEKLRADEARLEDDLRTARGIQKGLLPDAAPHTPGINIGFAYQPARQLGGDFYDFLTYGPHRLAIAVGDVAGKATPAALYGALAIGILRGHALEHRCPPAEMLGLMNEALREPRIDNRFVAMSFAVYDSAEQRLTIANAAFPKPWLRRNGEVTEIDVEGLPLGIVAGASYDERELELRPGDLITMCSDGLLEQTNAAGDEFGSRRLQSLLQELSGDAQEIADSILAAAERFAVPGTEPLDDRTVVVLEILDR